LGPIRSIPGDKIFLAQLADAPNLHLDALSWSRHFHCFPGQGELPVAAFCEAVAVAGYGGPLSLEIFHDQFRAADTGRIAADGKRSLILLRDRLTHAGFDNPENFKALPAKTSCLKIEFIEFAPGEDSASTMRKLFAAMGFTLSGRHISKSVE